MVGRHHQFNGHEFVQTPGDGEGQGSLACSSPWGHKELDTNEQLNNNNNNNQQFWRQEEENDSGFTIGLNYTGFPRNFTLKWSMDWDFRRREFFPILF